MSKDPVNSIELKTAQSWAKKWRKVEGTYNAHHEVHGFLIPLEDLRQILEEGPDAVRVYLGVDENDEEKLMLVGTRYNEERETYDDMVSGAINEGLIYDFTRPCPPACGYNSPLDTMQIIDNFIYIQCIC